MWSVCVLKMVFYPGLLIQNKWSRTGKVSEKGNKNEEEQQDAEGVHGAASIQKH